MIRPLSVHIRSVCTLYQLGSLLIHSFISSMTIEIMFFLLSLLIFIVSSMIVATWCIYHFHGFHNTEDTGWGVDEWLQRIIWTYEFPLIQHLNVHTTSIWSQGKLMSYGFWHLHLAYPSPFKWASYFFSPEL
jgi:hypothetical protein